METKHDIPFRRPNAIERLFNRCFGFLVGLGFGMKHNYLLQVRGRKSGNLYSTPIDLLEMNGRRFLVAPRGRTQWVRNAEASGEVALKRGRWQQSFSLRTIPDVDKPEFAEGLSRQLQDCGSAILPCSRRFGRTGVRGDRTELPRVRIDREAVIGAAQVNVQTKDVNLGHRQN